MSKYITKPGCEWPVLEPSWTEMFPDGRGLFYEGDDPEEFRQNMITNYSFDPALDNSGWNEDCGYFFHCPASALNEIYSDHSPYPLGS